MSDITRKRPSASEIEMERRIRWNTNPYSQRRNLNATPRLTENPNEEQKDDPMEDSEQPQVEIQEPQATVLDIMEKMWSTEADKYIKALEKTNKNKKCQK